MKGTTIQIAIKTQIGVDPFGAPIYSDTPIYENVPNVLVGQPTTDDFTTSINLYGKKVEYILGIPKGDTHNWVDAEVIIWGEKYHTFGFPITGEPENIPLRWGQNVRVERYE